MDSTKTLVRVERLLGNPRKTAGKAALTAALKLAEDTMQAR
jgi:hypothetical protein